MPRGPEPKMRRVEGNGYVTLYMPDHPHAHKSNRVLEHRYVMEQHLGRYLLPSEHVHHKDKNRQNNAIENLELVEPAEHTAHHKREESLAKPLWDMPLEELVALYNGSSSWEIAEKYNVSQSCVLYLLRKRGIHVEARRSGILLANIQKIRDTPREVLQDEYNRMGLKAMGNAYGGICNMLLRSLLKERGIEIRPRGHCIRNPRQKSALRSLPKEELARLYSTMTMQQMADAYNCSISTVLFALRDHGLAKKAVVSGS